MAPASIMSKQWFIGILLPVVVVALYGGLFIVGAVSDLTGSPSSDAVEAVGIGAWGIILTGVSVGLILGKRWACYLCLSWFFLPSFFIMFFVPSGSGEAEGMKYLLAPILLAVFAVYLLGGSLRHCGVNRDHALISVVMCSLLFAVWYLIRALIV